MIKIPLDDLQPGQTSKQFASIQEKNLEHLIKILGTKESIEALTAISKIDKNTWKDINESISDLKDFALGGGISALKGEITTIVQENIQWALGPLYNELQPIINEVMRAIEPLMPFIVDIIKWGTDILVPIIQWMADVLQDIVDWFGTFGQGDLAVGAGVAIYGSLFGNPYGNPLRPPPRPLPIGTTSSGEGGTTGGRIEFL